MVAPHLVDFVIVVDGFAVLFSSVPSQTTMVTTTASGLQHQHRQAY